MVQKHKDKDIMQAHQLAAYLALVGTVGSGIFAMATQWESVEPMLESPVFRVVGVVSVYVLGMFTYHILRVPGLNQRISVIEAALESQSKVIEELQKTEKEYIKLKARQDMYDQGFRPKVVE